MMEVNGLVIVGQRGWGPSTHTGTTDRLLTGELNLQPLCCDATVVTTAPGRDDDGDDA